MTEVVTQLFIPKDRKLRGQLGEDYLGVAFDYARNTKHWTEQYELGGRTNPNFLEGYNNFHARASLFYDSAMICLFLNGKIP